MVKRGLEMMNQKDNLYIELLLSFFRLIGVKSELKTFNVSIVDKYTKNAKAKGSVLWEDDIIDDEPQSFIWYIPSNNIFIKDSILLINYIIENNLIEGDKISISESELIENLLNKNWKKDIIKEALEYLLNLDIRMVDEGEETSAFFVHF